METIAASGLSFWLAWRLGSIKHIVLASALVPFLLLRTRLSTWYAVRVWKALAHRFQHIHASGSTHTFLVFLAVPLLLGVPCIKAFATVKIFLRRPIKSASAIPVNFVRDVVVLDAVYSPRIFPGSEELKGANSFPNIHGLWTEISTVFYEDIINRPRAKFVTYGLYFPSTVMMFVPMTMSAIIYRWALKSTAVVWLPLIWIVVQARPGTQIIARLVVMTRSAWSKTVLVYSVFVLFAFCAKLALLFGFWHFANLDWLGQLGVAATRFVAPSDFEIWQGAAAVNALLALAFFYHADIHLLAQGTGEVWPEVWVRREYAIYQVVRTILSLYVIACTFYITAAVAWQTEWPPIRFVLFPWTA